MNIAQIKRNSENQLAATLRLKVDQFVKTRKNRLKLAGEIHTYAEELVRQVAFHAPEEVPTTPPLTQPMSKDRQDDERRVRLMTGADELPHTQKPY